MIAFAGGDRTKKYQYLQATIMCANTRARRRDGKNRPVNGKMTTECNPCTDNGLNLFARRVYRPEKRFTVSAFFFTLLRHRGHKACARFFFSRHNIFATFLRRLVRIRGFLFYLISAPSTQRRQAREILILKYHKLSCTLSGESRSTLDRTVGLLPARDIFVCT